MADPRTRAELSRWCQQQLDRIVERRAEAPERLAIQLGAWRHATRLGVATALGEPNPWFPGVHRLAANIAADGSALDVGRRVRHVEHVADLLARIIAVVGADSKADKSEKKLPQNTDVLRLLKVLRKRGGNGVANIEIAREITEGNDRKAKSLLRQVRRYAHLLNGGH